MRIELMRRWDYAYECVTLLNQHVDGEATERYIGGFCERHGLDRERLEPLFAEIWAVQRQVLPAVDTADAAVGKYFRSLHGAAGECLASLLLTPPVGQEVQEYIQGLLAHTPRQRLRWLGQVVLGHIQARIFPADELDAIGSVEQLLRAVFAESIPGDDKLLLAEICVNTDVVLRDLAGIMGRAIAAFRQAEGLLEPRLRESLAHLEALLDLPGLTLGDLTEGRLNGQASPDSVLYFYPTAMCSYSRRYNISDAYEETLHFGINVPALKQLVETADTAVNAPEILRLLGDATKQDILHRLRAGRMYGQELAAALGLSTATISYHMNLLIQQRMVSAERENTRIYYSLDGKGMARAVEVIGKFLGVE